MRGVLRYLNFLIASLPSKKGGINMTKMEKGMVIVAAIILTALACVKFGYNLGVKQATYSLSKSSDESEDVSVPQEKLDSTSDISFVSNGEPISQTDEFGWLLPAAAGSLNANGEAIKAELSTDQEWQKSSSYSAVFRVPDGIFVNDAKCAANVYHQKSVTAGETGLIIVVLSSDNGYVYCGACQFKATDDLQIVYGSEEPEVAIGGEFDVVSENEIKFNFYTSATDDHYQHRSSNSADQYGALGEYHMKYLFLE